MSKVKLSIIIVAYKRLDILIDCINSIYKYNDIGDGLEVIIVDNSPSKEYLYNYIKDKYNYINIVKNENNGFGAGNNVGARIARGKYILFLNPDTILIEPIMKFTVEKFDDDKNLVLFGVKLVNKDLIRNMSYAFIDKSGILSNKLIKIYNSIDLFNPNNMYISGANIFIRKDIFFKIGMFDENMFMYYEEADLTRRIRLENQNNKIRYFKEKRIIHLEGQTTEVSSNALEIGMNSLKYYCNKYNIDFERKIRNFIRYAKLKKIIYKFTGSFKYNNIVEEIKVYEKYL